MTIIKKLNQVINDKYYTFCDIRFNLFTTKDYFRIYDKVDGTCLYSDYLEFIDKIPEELANSTYKKEELIRLDINDLKSPFAICFYLEAPDNIEKPISMGTKFI